ncbi:MAG TPA: PaeR7I family type II restriction endonuclease [Lamprocystis sp. (in: g-proteobacteria)]|nr:PaeR7I family type II restriction endonuclease [Lamprocystis sp. (in: g-proteobacteria)]
MDYSNRLADAVRHFWAFRTQQTASQGSRTGTRDTGNRSAVTGGKHLDGFVRLLSQILEESGLPSASIHTKETTLPGFFRPTKNWDVVVVDAGDLVASIEFKAHVGPSFGNNFNNRVEEAIGNATDLLTAYRDGKFAPSAPPWLGWLMLLEDCSNSTSPVKVTEPHFKVFDEFKGASYARRYEVFCERLVRERLYNSACLILSNAQTGPQGDYTEPNPEFAFKRFATSLSAHAMAFARMRQ